MPSEETEEKILVVGLGSPIMSDDAIGLIVAQKIEDMHLENVETRQEAVGGLDIIPVLWGYRHAIIVDSIKTEQYEPGTIMIFDPEDFEPTITNASAHDINLATAMKIGRDMEPEQMPVSVRFVAMEVEDLQTMQEKLTPKVEAAQDSMVNAVKYLIDEFKEGFQKSN